jgi:hypothetical protein
MWRQYIRRAFLRSPYMPVEFRQKPDWSVFLFRIRRMFLRFFTWIISRATCLKPFSHLDNPAFHFANMCQRVVKLRKSVISCPSRVSRFPR